MATNANYSRLHPVSFALALGIVWAVILFAMAMLADLTEIFGIGFVQGIGTIYHGYVPTWYGGIIGAIWGFVDAFIIGLIFVWLYNIFCEWIGGK